MERGTAEPLSPPEDAPGYVKQVYKCAAAHKAESADVHACHQVLEPLSMTEELMMAMLHGTWCHPGDTKALAIYSARKGKGFPKNYRQLLPRFDCRRCFVCKGAQKYRVQKKRKGKKARRRKKRWNMTTYVTTCEPEQRALRWNKTLAMGSGPCGSTALCARKLNDSNRQTPPQPGLPIDS